MSSTQADIFRQAAELNAADPRREGNVVHIAAGCEVLASGDLHGHARNLARIAAYADLGGHPHRRLILQEIIHAPPDARTGLDRSLKTLREAARLKVAHPEQVLFLLGNHDLAQATGGEISKSGRGLCRAFADTVRQTGGPDEAGELLEAIFAFLLSPPVAVRCPGGVLICHSLPTPRRMALAGAAIPSTPYGEADLRRGGWAYEWTWGRDHTPEQIERLAEHMGVSFFVLGHRHIPGPFEVLSPRAIALTAEHDRGAILQFASEAALDGSNVHAYLKPIASLALAGGA